MKIERTRVTKVDFCMDDKPLSEILDYVYNTRDKDESLDFIIEGDYARFLASGEVKEEDVAEIMEHFPGSRVEPTYLWLVE